MPGRTFVGEAMQRQFGNVQQAAYPIIGRKGRTGTAIGSAIARIGQAVRKDRKCVLPVSARLNGEDGIEGVCLSGPSVIGSTAVETRILPEPTTGELDGLRRWAVALNRVLKNVMSAGKTRQNPTKKRSLCAINEHLEEDFNAVWPSAIGFQQLVKERLSALNM